MISARQGLCIVVALFVGEVSCLSAAADKVPGVVSEATGKVKALDLDLGVITLLLGDEDEEPRSEKKYSLSGRTIPVSTEFGDKPGMAQVKPGSGVILGLSGDDDVIAITLLSPRVRGRIKAVDPDQQTITLHPYEQAAEAKFILAKTAKVRLDRSTWEVSDLFPGVVATLVLSLDRTAAHQVLISVKSNYASVRGALVGVNPKTHTIQLLSSSSNKYQVRTYPVARNFRFLFQRDLRKLTLNDLKGVDSVEAIDRALPVGLYLDEKGETVLAIAALPPHLDAVVRSVDASRRVLTVTTTAGVETFTVDGAADIVLEGRKQQLAEVKAGTPVELHLGLNRTEVVAIHPVKAAQDD